MKKKIKRFCLPTIVIALIGLLSNILVRKTSIDSFSIFDTTTLFSYFGVLIGFALTIYTFGLSMVSDITDKIQKQEKIQSEQKEIMHNNLISGFCQIKEDIWLIFYSIIIVIIFAVVREIPNPLDYDTLWIKMPETINLTLFITTTIAMWDIMKTLFNLSEINLELNRSKAVIGKIDSK